MSPGRGTTALSNNCFSCLLILPIFQKLPGGRASCVPPGYLWPFNGPKNRQERFQDRLALWAVPPTSCPRRFLRASGGFLGFSAHLQSPPLLLARRRTFMPLKTNIGVSRKVADNNYGSRGASVNMEVELDSTLINDPERFHDRVRQVFRLAQQAIDEELTRQRQGGVASYFSTSRLNCWLRCPLAFRFTCIDGIRQPTTPSLFLGHVVHGATETLYVSTATHGRKASAFPAVGGPTPRPRHKDRFIDLFYILMV